jgi:hypothetical protein
MFGKYRVVCTTPAGRRRYLRILAPQILASPLVDEYHLWINTTDAADLEFCRQLPDADARVRLIDPTFLPPGPTLSIRQFYRGCIDPDTIYIRFDDDVVFVEPDFVEKFVTFRVEHPQFFLVFPNTINNALCTYAQIEHGNITAGARVQPWCMDVTAWANPRFAEQLHRAFLASVAAGDIASWYFGQRLVAYSRYSVNCIAWFGSEFAKFQGEVPWDEEEYLSVTKPAELLAVNCIYGEAIVAHYAFMPQRTHLDATDVLARYAAAASSSVRSSRATSRADKKPHDLWTPRLLDAVDRLQSASDVDLRSADFVADQIRTAGLAFDRRFLYGDDNRYMNTERTGVPHLPMQLARCLVALSRHAIRRVVDLAVGNGWRTTLIAAYLSRFNDDVQVIGLDRGDTFIGYDAVATRVPIQYRPNTGPDAWTGHAFDLAVIGTGRSYEACLADYRAVGRFAAICLVDGINDRFASRNAAKDGGVPRLWRELSSSSTTGRRCEFLDHSQHEAVMGLGLLLQSAEVPA